MSDRFWTLYARKLSGEASSFELKELAAIMKSDPELARKARMFDSVWKEEDDPQYFDEEEVLDTIRVKAGLRSGAVSSKSEQQGTAQGSQRWLSGLLHLPRRPSMQVAAVLLFSLLLGMLLLGQRDLLQIGIEDTRAAKDQPSTRTRLVNLPDGSNVYLKGPQSTLKYPGAFSDSIRKVTLVGEAFFDVAHDPERPFIIDLKDSKIQVLGTSFHVRAQPDEDQIETRVEKGKVLFVPGKQSGDHIKDVYLTSNQSVRYSASSGDLIKLEKDGPYKIEFRGRHIILRSVPYDEVGRIMEKRFNSKIVLNDKSLEKCRFTATILEENTVEDVIRFFKTSKPDLNYSRNGNVVTLYGTGCQ